MVKKFIRPYGSWKSPLTSDLIVSETVKLSEINIDGNDVYWLENRPFQNGRNVIVRLDENGNIKDSIPKGFNARTRAHEYGGGSYKVSKGVVYFSNYNDQRIYRCTPGDITPPQPVTPEGNYRYADFVIDQVQNRLICVREDHTSGNSNPTNSIVSICLEKENPVEVIISGNDFYSSPGMNSDNTHLCWLTWNHPNMPWDGTELWAGQLSADGKIAKSKRIAGARGESVFQPKWDSEGYIYFVSDRTGWWNLYRYKDEKTEALCPIDAEFGAPQWVFGLSTYAFVTENRIISACSKNGVWKLGFIKTSEKRFEYLKLPYTEVSSVCSANNSVYFIGGSFNSASSVIQLRMGTLETKVLKSSNKIKLNNEFISEPEIIKYKTGDNEVSHALVYLPKNRDYKGPEGEKPPLIVKTHGGPTSCVQTSLSFETQYWTSRGFAVADVNYRGSTGYGREYRQALNGKWGIADVQDCINAAKHLASSGIADKNSLIIKGGSAGGYTTMCALTFHDTFNAGVSYYGVSDLDALAKETHKFESRYLDALIGPYPEKKNVYFERSPINFAKKISCPMLFFQGLDDKVVPPSQSQRIYDALLKKGLPVAYSTFKDEQHGFRSSQNIKACFEAELYFYSKIFNIKIQDKIKPIKIENLKKEISNKKSRISKK
ncbi:MAG: S9 family peptidase [Elusimicrobia bacterium]|nr:S9 family peptidase [Candidatus Liberimonas magnetica]